LDHLWVFEDCLLLVLQDGQALLLHVSDPAATGSVLYVHHANGTLWRVLPVEQLNPGWVLSAYRFDGNLHDLAARLARMHSRPARPAGHTRPTFWHSGGWPGAVAFTSATLVGRIRTWQFSPLAQPQVSTATAAQAEQLNAAYPADVQQLLALSQSGVTKVTYQLGGLNLALSYRSAELTAKPGTHRPGGRGGSPLCAGRAAQPGHGHRRAGAQPPAGALCVVQHRRLGGPHRPPSGVGHPRPGAAQL
jgi:hypothetical protein